VPQTFDDKIYKELSNKFKVSRRSCEYIDELYTTQILPRIKKQYLAHLIAAIEEIINEKRREEQKKNPADKSNMKPCRFHIGLHQYEPAPGKNAQTIVFKNKNVCIIYKEIDTENIEEVKKLRIYIAHELGHVIRENGLVQGTNLIENYANVFAYFAIKGKSDFYKDKNTKKLVYKDESEIIEEIYDLCPIHDYLQSRRTRKV